MRKSEIEKGNTCNKRKNKPHRVANLPFTLTYLYPYKEIDSKCTYTHTSIHMKSQHRQDLIFLNTK